MRTTIADVAKAAGVSIKTVSRVLNGEGKVSEQTRQRVKDIVAALGFYPSSAARTLAGRKSFQIAFLYDNPSPYYVYQVQAGIHAACVAHNYRAIFHHCQADADDLINQVIALVEETHLDGLVLSPPVTDSHPLVAELIRRNVRHVRIGKGPVKADGSVVGVDDAAAAADMTRHLIALGHRRIGFIKGHRDHVSSAERLRGFMEVLREAGVAVDPGLIIDGRFDFESGREAAALLLNQADPPTAIFSSNDDMAAGVMATAHALGLVIPDDLSITGFDDTPLATAVWPPMTTMRQPLYDIGLIAAQRLLDFADAPGETILATELQLRASTGPPNGSR